MDRPHRRWHGSWTSTIVVLLAGAMVAWPSAARALTINADAIAVPRVDAAGSLTITPNAGPAGIPITVTGTGFAPGETIQVSYKTNLAPPSPTKVSLCTATGSSTGGLSCSATVPSGAGPVGPHTIVAKGTTSGFKAKGTFTRVLPGWPQYGFGSGRNAYQPDEITLDRANVAGLKPAFTIVPLFGNVDSQAEQPVIAGGVLYVPDCGFNDSSGLDDCEIMALDAVSGARRWDQFVGSFSGNEPLPLAVDAGRLFVPYRGTSLDAVDATTGATTLWSASIPVASPAAVADGTVYVGGSDGNVYALAADTGAQRWAAHTAGSVSQPVAVANGVVYAGSDDGHLYAFDEATGTQKWSVSSGGPTQAYPSVGDGMVFVASAHGFNAFDAVTGAQRWTFAGGLFSNFFAAAVDRAKVYLTDETGPLRAFDVATGTLLWSSPVSGHPWEPADANGVLYVGTDAGGSAFNTDTGAVLWTFPVHLGGPCGLFQGGAVVHGMLYSSCGGLKL